MGNGDGSSARAYHDRTKHSAASVRSSRHFLDWDIQPRPFKIYPTLDPIPTPSELPPVVVPALDAIGAIASAEARVPDFIALTQILRYSAGITKRRRYPGGEILFRAAACTGALYHVDLYVVCGDLPGLDAGVYHYGPHDDGLVCLRAGDHRSALIGATGREPAVAAAPAVLVCTSTYWRNAWKYQARAYRHCFWDGGTLLAHVLALAAAHALPARVVVGFVDDAVNRLLGVDDTREATIALVALGRMIDPVPAAVPVAPEPLAPDTLPLSVREVQYPAIQEMHAASSLDTSEAVARWRARPGPVEEVAAHPVPAGPLISLQPYTAGGRPRDALDRVIRRRASTRVFAHDPLPLGVLSTALQQATRGVPADCPPATTFNQLYLIVNAVEGLTPGAYVFHRERGALELLRPGNFRREAGYLDLGQALAADASVDIFVLANLEPILERYGDRGYRAAALEAGIIGGKLYLAAYAQRAGATGLTFFDDDVIAFFSPHADGKSVMFLVALGIPAQGRGRRPA